jgi:hypothetical protein
MVWYTVDKGIYRKFIVVDVNVNITYEGTGVNGDSSGKSDGAKEIERCQKEILIGFSCYLIWNDWC